MEEFRDVIITDSLADIGSEAYADYLCHALCTGGECRMVYNEAPTRYMPATS